MNGDSSDDDNNGDATPVMDEETIERKFLSSNYNEGFDKA